MTANTTFPALLEAFFTDRLLQQKLVSPHTIASYRDTFCLLLRYAQQRLHKAPAKLTLVELNAPKVIAFLDHLQQKRGTSARCRNVRLAAIDSFFQYAALQAPDHSGLIEPVLAIPGMRYERNSIEFLTHAEIEALLAATDQRTWIGRRDRTLLLLALQAWQREQQSRLEAPVFPNARGQPLSRDGVAYLLAKYVAMACQHCPSLQHKRVTPHVLRHSAAMELLQSGVDCAVIALWLGHESMDTTQIYLHASLELKERALEKTTPINGRTGRYRPDDELMAFLKGL
jgi:site-specific recombinase XerD